MEVGGTARESLGPDGAVWEEGALLGLSQKNMSGRTELAESENGEKEGLLTGNP